MKNILFPLKKTFSPIIKISQQSDEHREENREKDEKKFLISTEVSADASDSTLEKN